jgi:protein-L-isoaspartate(D-aspartate) O-methyltransferase
MSSVSTGTTADPWPLRAALADYVRARGTFRNPRVEAAFRAVPRHLFLPGTDLRAAYAPQVVVTKRDGGGTAISSASHPNLVAEMLEQLAVQPGHRVLEIGAATGINAALLAELAGPAGPVATIEIDDDLAAGARAALSASGYQQVQVICADGADGHPAGAPYDRIIVTAGAWDLAPAWWEQLTAGGRLVVPLRLHGSGLTRSIAFDLRNPDRMVSASAQVCGFVPMRGAAAHAERSVPLTSDVALHLDGSDLADEAALGQALTHPAHEHWTGVEIGDDQPVEHLDLWLSTVTRRFARLSAGQAARESGLVTPARRWAGAALYDGGTIAYLAARQRSSNTAELGAIAHGPDSRRCAARAAELLHQWDRDRPAQPVITARPARAPEDQLQHGHRIRKPHTSLTITW